MTLLHEACGAPCSREGCKAHCDWMSAHNADDGLHLCWRHIKEWEEEQYLLEDDYKGADHE